MNDLSALLAAYDQELRIDIEYPGARKEILPQLVRFVRPAPGMNFVLYSRLNPDEADAAIQAQIDYFTPMGQPFTWKVFEHDQPADLKQRLEAHGFACEEPSPVLALDLHKAPPALLEPVTMDIRLLTHRKQLDDVIAIEEQVWGGAFGWIKQRMGDHMELPGYLSVYVAHLDEQPVSAGWVYFHPESQFAGLFGGSTLEGYRKRGLYTALLAVRAQEAIRRGYHYLLIEPSDMSRPIVTSHGFRLLVTSYDYEWQGQS
ncbi:MAG TPA: GNAT family N-acetyltransferase [Roseiflexaceae bacterium]|nr:GNAT family N-acetyltransferase [Roseiflexaceae bacterium]